MTQQRNDYISGDPQPSRSLTSGSMHNGPIQAPSAPNESAQEIANQILARLDHCHAHIGRLFGTPAPDGARTESSMSEALFASRSSAIDLEGQLEALVARLGVVG